MMLADHVSKSEHSRDLHDSVSKSNFQALSVSEPEFSQLLGVLYEENLEVARKMQVLQTLARKKKKRSGSL